MRPMPRETRSKSKRRLKSWSETFIFIFLSIMTVRNDLAFNKIKKLVHKKLYNIYFNHAK